MDLFLCVVYIWLILLITLSFCYDHRRPMSTKLIYKCRVKDNSIFRKIIKFKDTEDFTCNYFKIVPFYIFLLLAILSLILLFVDIFTNGFISNIVPEKTFIIAPLCIYGISTLYFLVITIWWEIVDYKVFKFTKEEKNKLKQLRKFRKENKKNKKQ